MTRKAPNDFALFLKTGRTFRLTFATTVTQGMQVTARADLRNAEPRTEPRCSSEAQSRERSFPAREPPGAARSPHGTQGRASRRCRAGGSAAPRPALPTRAAPDPQQLLPGRRDRGARTSVCHCHRPRCVTEPGPATPGVAARAPPAPHLPARGTEPLLPSAVAVPSTPSGDAPRPCPGPSLPRGARALRPRSGTGGTAPGDAARPSRRSRRTPEPRPRPAPAPGPLPPGSPCTGLHLPGSHGAGGAGAAAGGAARALPASRPPPPRRCGGAAHAPPGAADGAAQGAGRARRSRAAPRGQRRTRHRDLPGTLPGNGEPEPALLGPSPSPGCAAQAGTALEAPARPQSRGSGRRCRHAGKLGPRPHAAPPGRGSPAPARRAEPRGDRVPPWGGRAEPRGTGGAARRQSPAAGTSPGRRYLRCPGGRGARCHRAAAMALLGRERLRPARMDRTT